MLLPKLYHKMVQLEAKLEPLILFLVYLYHKLDYGLEWVRVKIEQIFAVFALVFAVVSSAVAIGFLVLWGTITWSESFQKTLNENIILLNTVEQEVTVDFPATIFIQNEPLPLTLNLYVKKTYTTTQQIEVRVNLPDGVIEVDNPHFETISSIIEFEDSGFYQEIIYLKNDRTLDTFGVDSDLEITLKQQPSKSLPIRIEGVKGFTLRDLVQRNIGENNLAFLFVTLLIPGASAYLLQYFTLRSRRIETERREEATALIEGFRHSFLQEDIETAEAKYQLLLRPRLYGVAQENIEVIENIFNLTRLSGDSKDCVQRSQIWPDVCVMAYVLAIEMNDKTIIQSKKQILIEVWRILPEAGRRNSILHKRLNKSIEVLDSSIQDRVTWENFSTKTKFQSLRRGGQYPFNLTDGVINPFGALHAHEEVNQLFHQEGPEGQPAFVGNHPFFAEDNRRLADIIFGKPGSGRTTLALSLHHKTKEDILTTYISQPCSIDELKHGLTIRLFHFVLQHGTLLTKLTLPQLNLLAHILIKQLGKLAVLAELERAQAQLWETQWFKNAENESQKNNWLQLSFQQFQYLKHLVSEVIVNNDSDEISQLWDISVCAHALEFRRIMPIFDVSRDDFPWLEQNIFPQTSLWASARVQPIFFLPSSIQEQAISSSHGLSYEELHWDREKFKKMIETRYMAFAGDRKNITLLFEEGVFDEMLRASLYKGSYNPRRFIQLWLACLKDHDQGSKISLADILLSKPSLL